MRRAEQARALMLELFPEGFEEVESSGGVELAAYTDAGGEERLWQSFGGSPRSSAVSGEDVEEGWEDRWRRFHHPVRIGPLWIGPPWEEAPPEAHAIVIDPGRAFGTGAHPTTRLCVETLLELEPGSLLDVGCGSGVIALAAAKLGFAPVVAIDVDPAAVEATERNAVENGVEIDARLVDPLASPLPAAHLAVANITLEAVLLLAPRLECARVVTSGYLAFEAPALTGFRRTDRREADGWAADLHERE